MNTEKEIMQYFDDKLAMALNSRMAKLREEVNELTAAKINIHLNTNENDYTMKKFLLKKKKSRKIICEFDSAEKAQVYVIKLVRKNRTSIFDYSIKEVEYEDSVCKFPSYKTSKEILGNDDSETSIKVSKSNAKAFKFLNELITIAKAWNKLDNFVPDFSDKNQKRYIPRFILSNNKIAYYDTFCSYGICGYTNLGAKAGLGYFHSSLVVGHALADVGFRSAFKTKERSEQFGKLFIDLWNNFLLFR